MAGEISLTEIPVTHVKIVLAVSFDSVRRALESALPRLDVAILRRLDAGEVEQVLRALEAGPELAIFQTRDHGSVLRLAGLVRRALQYDIGNPLTASRMTRHQLAAALYAPFRVVLYEDADGHAVIEYDRPSSLFGQFGDERVTAVARGLDAALERVLRQLDDKCDGLAKLSAQLPLELDRIAAL